MAKGRGLKGKAEKVSEKDFQKQLQHLVADLTEASDKLKGKSAEEGPQGPQPHHPAHRSDARRPLQPVDRPVDA